MNKAIKIMLVLVILSALLLIVLLFKNNNIKKNEIKDNFVYVEEVENEVK